MRRLLLPLALLGLVIESSPATAQVKYPARPETVDVQIRYRIRADRDERVRQFRVLEAYLKQLGFERRRFPNDEQDIIDPNAERFEGTIPSKNVFAILDDPRVRTILFRPTTFNLPESAERAVQVRISIPAGLLGPDQQRLHRQTVAQLSRLGFREAVSYDHRGYALVRGELPFGNLFRLLKDLRQEPAGWFVADAPADQLPPPLRDVLPILAVEVLPDPDLVPLNPQPIPPNRARQTPDLRAVLDAPANLAKPVRVEVIYDFKPDPIYLEGLRGRLRSSYGAPVTNPATQTRETAYAALEGAAGNVVTIRFPLAADVDRFANEPGVVGIRLPRASEETPAALVAPPADALVASRLDALHKLGYRGQGTRVVVIATEFAGLGSWSGFRFLDKSLTTPVAYIDLTTELSAEILPAPPSGRPSAGMTAARAAHLAAPDALLVLVRVDPASFFQLLTIARFVRGDTEYSDALQTRLAEIAARGTDLRQRNAEAAAEYRKAFGDPKDDDATKQRRDRARRALEVNYDELQNLGGVVRRFSALQQSLLAMNGTQVVVNTLVWESGFPHDGLSELSQVIDGGFAGEAMGGASTRSASRPTATPRPLWVQPAGGAVGSIWSGPFLDADGNGAMEFSDPRLPIPGGGWTRELNFLDVLGPDGKVAPTLVSGTRVRLTVQWRETHDPTAYAGRDAIFPLTPRVFRQLDPTGMKQATDELQEVARSVGGPYRLWSTANYGVYEQIVEFTVPADGRYCVRLDGLPLYDHRLPALKQRIEVTPRLFPEFLGGATGRPVFASYGTRSVGVGIPGDAKAAVTVGSAAGVTGGGPGLALLPKPDVIDGASSVGFVGGAAAVLIGSGVPASSLFRATGIPRGGPFVIPETWLRGVPRRP